MSHIDIHPFPTPFGELVLGSFEERLCLCDWRYRRMREGVDQRLRKGLGSAFREGRSPVIETAMAQLKAYFAGERRTFDVPLRFVGSQFQQRVWEALQKVPYGSTSTYAELTARVASPAAIRAVASANGANALSILVPCHRIIGSSGELVGYAGGLPAKRKLLQLEGAHAQEQPDLFHALSQA